MTQTSTSNGWFSKNQTMKLKPNLCKKCWIQYKPTWMSNSGIWTKLPSSFKFCRSRLRVKILKSKDSYNSVLTTSKSLRKTLIICKVTKISKRTIINLIFSKTFWCRLIKLLLISNTWSGSRKMGIRCKKTPILKIRTML